MMTCASVPFHTLQVLATVDGISLPADPVSMMESGQMQRVPIIAGANTNDANLFVIGFDEFEHLNTEASTYDHEGSMIYMKGSMV